ncbi:hypothetical protein B0O80DRAFT_429182 [Mortierella sp. GBAus27b]|nr:hypothetical protein BGX31_000571 [Mortierella sp. GBA43]KAI8349070.1 hypothetical protein B0O80DRAFT_429182 [Mortierella sp. GBAus27b]
MTLGSDTEPFQTFHCHSTGKAFDIPTTVDPKTGRYIVLWSDVQDAFDSVKSVRHGRSLVPFLKDENLERITPLRIAYHPDQVLEVMTEDDSQISRNRDNFITTTTPVLAREPNKHDMDAKTLTGAREDFEIVECNGSSSSSSIDNSCDQSLVICSGSMVKDTQASLMIPQDPSGNTAALQTLLSGQLTMLQSMNRLQTEMDKNSALQEQVVQMQQQQQDNQTVLLHKQEEILQMQEQIEQLHQEKSAEIIKRQEEMLQLQQKALDRLSVIQSTVQALVAQTYELHEYPIPRLFIVLPTKVGFSGKLKSVFSDHFRLYFLCECGTHTMADGQQHQPPHETPHGTPHQIHFAKHEGYELERPSAFFEKFGSYILILMHMIKYGITAAGLIVPPLATSKIVEGLDTAQKHMDYLKKNIGPLVDDTIKFLNGIKSGHEAGDELATNTTGFDQLEALEGADLRQLESYLKLKDKGRILGNLYRIVTSKGHVKWVCFDHYKAAYRESTIKRLQEVVDANGGDYITEMGRIKINIATKTLAKEFYEAMIKARGIQELEITLEWDVTMDDLHSFANAVAKANVVHLTVHGASFKSPPLDLANRSQRFDPIMQLASSGRLQSLQLKHFEGFFSRVSKSSFAPGPKLRVLSISSDIPVKSKVISLGKVLEYYSSLTTLEVKLYQQSSVSDAILDILKQLPMLQLLKVDCMSLSISATVLKGVIQTAILKFDQVEDLLAQDLKFIQKDTVTKVAILWSQNDLNWTRLSDNPDFIWCQPEERGMFSMKGLRRHKFFLVDVIGVSGRSGTLETKSINVHLKDQFTFIRRHMDTGTATMYLSKDADPAQVLNIIRQPEYCYIRISDPGGNSLKTLAMIEWDIHDLAKTVTFGVSNELKALYIDYKGFALKTSVLQASNEMGLTIERPDDLGSRDLKFTQWNCITNLAIECTRETELLLAGIFYHCPSLNHLGIGCRAERIIHLVDLVVSARRRAIQDRGSCNLRSFRLMKEELTPFDVAVQSDQDTLIQSHIAFKSQEDLDSFDMRTWIRHKSRVSSVVDDAVIDLIRRFGRSIVYFDGNIPLADDHVFSMTDAHQELVLRSKGTAKQHDLNVTQVQWQPWWKRRWQPRFLWTGIPTVEPFMMQIHSKCGLDSVSQWMVTLLARQCSEQEQNLQESNLEPTRSRILPKAITMAGVSFQPEEWKAVLETMDFTRLETLNVQDSNFSRQQLQQLLDQLDGISTSDLALKTLGIGGTVFGEEANVENADARIAMLDKLRLLVPSIEGDRQ